MTRGATAAVRPSGDGVGTMLRARREALGLTQADVAAIVKLPARRIDAMESERWQELPDGPYLRGFLRNVARALDLDADTLVARVDASVGRARDERPLVAPGATTHVPLPRRSGPADDRRGGRAFVFGAVAFALVAALIAWSGTDSFDRALTAGKALVESQRAGATTSAPAAASTSAGGAAVAQTVPAADAPGGSPAPTAASTAVVPIVERSTPPVGAAPPTASPPDTADAGVPLVVHVTADTWLEVRGADGKVLVRRTVPAGSDQRFDGQAPFSVVIGNTTGVALRFRGQAVDLAPYTKGQVARFTLS